MPPLLRLGLALCLTTATGARADLFDHAGMTAVSMRGMKVWLGQPVQITAQIGYSIGWAHDAREPGWAFIHLTPFLAEFPRGELLATYTMDPDTQGNPFFLSGYQISKDGGAHWGRRANVLMEHNPMVFVPKADDSLLGIPSEFMPLSPGDERNFVGPGYLFKHGGDSMELQMDRIRVLDWPWPDGIESSPQPSEDWHVEVCITGSVLPAGGRLVATANDEKKGDSLYLSVAVVSADGGFTWRYLSTIAGPDRSLASQKGYEGPNETSMVRLADGDLMAVIRVGGSRAWQLRRNYSHDEGRSWSKPDILPAWSVKPQLIRTSNGVIALSTGRPGIYLWLSDDPRAEHWQSIDLMAHHNAWAGNSDARISSFANHGRENWQTTSYTNMVEVAPNKLILIYDRDPERPPTRPTDLSRVYVMAVEIERTGP